MTIQSREKRSVPASDGVLALVIAVLCILPYNHVFAEMSDRHSTPLSFADAAFGVAFVLGWRYCFNTLKLYSRFLAVSTRLAAIVKGVCIMSVPVIAFMLLFHRWDFSLHAVVALLLGLFTFGIARTFLFEYLLDRLAERDPRRAIILGSGRRAGKAWREIRTRYHSSMTVLGFIDDRDPAMMAPEVAQLYLGRVDDLTSTILERVVDVLLIAMPIKSCYPQMQRAVDIAESVGVKVVYLGDIYSSSKQGRGSEETMFTELAPEQDQYLVQNLIKRILDIFCAVIGLVLLSPLMLLIALGIKLTSRGPILFCQQRYGYRRRLFNMCKFRTMVDHAEALFADLETINESSGRALKMEDDPRITAFGKFLRSASLDELPQLWNVLRGEMSMVGPRPMTITDVSLLSDATLMRRFSARAGITGLWQVSGRPNAGFREWTALDMRYIENWSLLMDLKIMLRTVGAVFKRSGAM